MRVPRGLRAVTGLAVAGAVAVLSGGPAAAGSGRGGGTVAYWHMDERAGATTMHDSSGHGNDGRLRNVTAGRNGAVRTAYYFAPYSIVVVPSAASLNPGSRDITISESVRTTARVRDWNVTQKGFSTTRGGQYKIEIRPRKGGSAGVVACVFRGSAGKVELVAGPNVADGRWHRIVCAKHATSVTLRVDNGRTYRVHRRVGSISNAEDLVIGSKMFKDDQYVGKIDEVSVVTGP